MNDEIICNQFLISGILAALIFCIAAGPALAEADRPVERDIDPRVGYDRTLPVRYNQQCPG